MPASFITFPIFTISDYMAAAECAHIAIHGLRDFPIDSFNQTQAYM